MLIAVRDGAAAKIAEEDSATTKAKSDVLMRKSKIPDACEFAPDSIRTKQTASPKASYAQEYLSAVQETCEPEHQSDGHQRSDQFTAAGAE